MLIHDNSVFADLKDDGVERIKLLKQSIGKTFIDSDHDKMLMKGSRWADNERIFYMACGEILRIEGTFERLSEEAGFAKMSAMNQQELDELYIKAMKESASADYWYRYEKDWG